jgi:lipopolysaccharide biosynthesis glycosyltransferase
MAQQYGRKIEFIPMQQPADFYHDDRFTFDSVGRTYGRMILGDVLPLDVHKVISLDSDTMILGNIEQLWNYDVHGAPIAGVDDCMGRVAMVKTQHLEEDTPHCNAGMYVVDLDVWRAENWTKLFEQYIRGLFDRGIALGGYEEEVITHTLSDRFFLLPPRFNVMTLELVLSYKELCAFRQPKTYYSEEEMNRAIESPVITHTTNFFYIRKRIFEANSDHPMRKNYEKYRALTPWKNDPPMDAHYSFKNKLMKNVWHWMPRPLSLVVARFVRNEIRPRLEKKRDDI